MTVEERQCSWILHKVENITPPDSATIGNRQQPVSKGRMDIKIVTNDNHRQVKPTTNSKQERQESILQTDVEPRKRFVEQQ